MLEGVRAALEQSLRDEDRVLLFADALPEPISAVATAVGNRAINFGIAESTMVSAAAGMATAGLRPVVVGLSPFLAARAYSQLRQDIALNGLPVTFVGFAAGAALADMGPSHCTLDDLGLVALLPGFDVAVAGDGSSAELALRRMLTGSGAGYLRVEGAAVEEPSLIRRTAEGGRWRPGTDVTVLAIGAAVNRALAAAEELTQTLNVEVVEAVQLRPLHPEVHDVLARARRLVIVEDHQAHGGLATYVREALGTRVSPVIVHVTPRAFGTPGRRRPSDFSVQLADLLAAVRRAADLSQP